MSTADSMVRVRRPILISLSFGHRYRTEASWQYAKGMAALCFASAALGLQVRPSGNSTIILKIYSPTFYLRGSYPEWVCAGLRLDVPLAILVLGTMRLTSPLFFTAPQQSIWHRRRLDVDMGRAV